MEESKKEPKQKMGIQEFIAAILSREDVIGAALIMPEQPIVRLVKVEGETEWEQ